MGQGFKRVFFSPCVTKLTSLGLDLSDGNDDDWPVEFLLEVVNDDGADLSVELERSEWNSNEDVLGDLVTGDWVLNLGSGSDESQTKVACDITGAALLQSGEGLGNLLLELGWGSLQMEHV